MRALYGAVMTLIALAMLGLVPNAARADSLPPAGGAPHLPMTLVADTNAPRAGQTMTLALDTRPEKGWHGYWRNPGDAGFAPSFDWTLPKGVTIDGAQWPVPETLVVAGLMNFVYATPYAPLFTVHVPAGLAVGTPLPIRVHVNYLVCTDTICVPEQQDVATSLKIGDGAPADGAAFDRWRAAIPKPLDAAATYQVDGGTVRIGIPLPATAKVEDAYFFAGTPGSLKYAAPQSVARDGDRLVIATQGTPTGRIEGVLRIGKGLGLSIRAAPGVVPAATGDGGGGDGAAWGAVLVAFAGALLGGLILNVMPCVFPILSLKALHLAKGGADERTARVDALGYTIGAVLTCVALGGAILALRAGGSAIGWAFQLQDPRVIVLLVALTLAIGLNLLGRFEVPTPQFATHGGAMGSIATGALAAFVATPCTGPFMGAALLVTAVIVAGGRRQRRGQSFGAPLGLAAVALPALAAVALTGVGSVHAAARADAFSEAKLAELRRQGRPVFAYFTADWCLTCKVNERAAIDTDTARAGFARHKVAVLVGDWTDGDPVLGRFIQAHNRAGVPLYLYYAPGAAGPRVLPQVLTPGMLAELQ